MCVRMQLYVFYLLISLYLPLNFLTVTLLKIKHSLWCNVVQYSSTLNNAQRLLIGSICTLYSSYDGTKRHTFHEDSRRQSKMPKMKFLAAGCTQFYLQTLYTNSLSKSHQLYNFKMLITWREIRFDFQGDG